MGLFRGIKNTIKKSEAAVVVQNLLTMQAEQGFYDREPASSANELVAAVWDKDPQLFDGRFGQRPHKLSVAASAFASAIQKLGQHTYSNSFAICLGNILSEIEVNGALYPLNSLDRELLESAASILMKYSSEFSATPLGKEIEEFYQMSELNWEDWLAEYKEEAGKTNSALAENEDGFSLIDLMDDEPIRQAHKDKQDPRKLGRLFAQQFDPLEFGTK